MEIAIRQQQFVLAPVADLQDHPLRADIELALQIAVALVRALGLDPEARALAGTVTASSNGLPIPLDDNAQIPPALRGYVQLALNLGILQATVSPLPAPHATFNPSGAVTRAAMARALARYRAHFAAGF